MARTVTRYTCRQYCTDRKTRVQSHQLHSKLPSWRIELFFPRCPSHAGGIRWSQDLKETQSVSEAEKKTRQAIFKLAGSWSKRNGPWADVRDLFANSFIRLKIICLMESWGKFFSCWKLPAVWWWAGRTLCYFRALFTMTEPQTSWSSLQTQLMLPSADPLTRAAFSSFNQLYLTLICYAFLLSDLKATKKNRLQAVKGWNPWCYQADHW